MKISVIVAACENELPEKGGGSRLGMLGRNLAQIKKGGHEDYEVLVCSDGYSEGVRSVVDATGDKRFHYACVPQRGVYGAGTQRNAMTAIATGDVLCYIDDDDRHVDGALKIIAERAAAHPGHPLVFCMQYRTFDRVLWTGDSRNKGKPPERFRGFVGTPMFVIPNVPAKLGRWGPANYADADFIDSTLAKGWSDTIWLRDIIATVRLQGDRTDW